MENKLKEAYNLEDIKRKLLASSNDKLDSIITLTSQCHQYGTNQVLAILVESLLKQVSLDTVEKKYVLELVKKMKAVSFENMEEFRTWVFKTSEILAEMGKNNALEYFYQILRLSGEVIVCKELLFK